MMSNKMMDESSGTLGRQHPVFNLKRFFVGIIMSVIVTGMTFGFWWLALSPNNDDAAMQYKTLNYDVQVQSNGDLKITEDMVVVLHNRDAGPWHQLYQTYTLESDQLTDISDVSVTRVFDSSVSEYTRKDFAMPSSGHDANWDSDEAGHWYIYDVTDSKDYDSKTDALNVAGDDSNKTLEIGWNIPEMDSGTLTFRLEMTFKNVATQYDDAARLMWEPVATNNKVSVSKLTGTVHLPSGANASNTWAWLHSEAESSTTRDSDGTLHFTVENLSVEQYVDLLMLVDNSAMDGVQRTHGGDIEQSTMDSEASKEESWARNQQSQARKHMALFIGLVLTSLVFIVWNIAGAFLSYKRAHYSGSIVYWREPPAMSPAAATNLNGVLIDGSQDTIVSRCMSSTLLSLASKRCIEVLPGPSNWYDDIDLFRTDNAQLRPYVSGIASSHSRHNANLTTTIMLKVDPGEDLTRFNLCHSERRLLELLEEVGKQLGSRVFDLAHMSKVWKNWPKGQRLMSSFTSECTNEFDDLRATKTQSALHGLPMFLGMLYSMFIMIALGNGDLGDVVMMRVATPICACAVFFVSIWNAVYGSSKAISPEGQTWAGQVQGFKNYLLDYSHFQDRDINDLLLWDRFLVYATAFGISDKVLQQLYVSYPTMSDVSWVDSTMSGSLWYWYVSPRANAMSGGVPMTYDGGFSGDAFGGFGDFAANLDAGFADVQSTFHEATAPSGGSSGGSFSGGGFGGGGGGAGGGSFGGR